MRVGKKLLLITLMLMGLIEPSYAKQGSMICKNARREYLVNYDTDEGTFIATAEEGDTAYSITSVQIVGDDLIIKGETMAGGPSFETHTTGRKKI